MCWFPFFLTFLKNLHLAPFFMTFLGFEFQKFKNLKRKPSIFHTNSFILQSENCKIQNFLKLVAVQKWNDDYLQRPGMFLRVFITLISRYLNSKYKRIICSNSMNYLILFKWKIQKNPRALITQVNYCESISFFVIFDQILTSNFTWKYSQVKPG